ncbi:hypothetical protein Tco_0750465 [Tanacetum coccineum]|uniref:Uncharacterized protein n=1 Tax=Tanacetum coccineum TaxID=301880 RepID=A0ABQ4Z1C0_9ASTR
MLGKTPNKVYHPFLKAGLGYKNPERLKKAIAAQSNMYNCDMLHSVNLKIDSPDLEETLEDAEEIQLKMRNKMILCFVTGLEVGKIRSWQDSQLAGLAVGRISSSLDSRLLVLTGLAASQFQPDSQLLVLTGLATSQFQPNS